MTRHRERRLERVLAPASEPVSLAEAKLYLRVTDNSEDALIFDLIVTARMAAEQFLQRSLIEQRWLVAYDDCARAELCLPMGPVQGIVSVKIYDRDTLLSTLPVESYYLNAARNKLVFASAVFGSAVGVGQRVEVIYTTGYGDASAVPKPIKAGMLSHVANLFDSRGEIWSAAGRIESAMLPQQVMQLYGPYREMRL